MDAGQVEPRIAPGKEELYWGPARVRLNNGKRKDTREAQPSIARATNERRERVAISGSGFLILIG